MTTSNVPPKEFDRGTGIAPATARLSLDGTTIYPNKGEDLPSLNRLNDPNIPVGDDQDKQSPILVNTNAGFFSGGDNTANAAIGVGVNAKAVTFTLGSVLSTEILQSIEEKRSKLFEDDKDEDTFLETAAFIFDEFETGAREESIIENYNKQVSGLVERNTSDSTKETTPILPRLFEDRSYLIFYSPQVKYVMPFFENPNINERRMVNYTFINNTGQTPLINYQWTNLAELKISFRLSYRHIAEILMKENLEANAFSFVAKTDLDKPISDVEQFFKRSGNQKNTDNFSPLDIYKKILKKEESEFLKKVLFRDTTGYSAGTFNKDIGDFFESEKNLDIQGNQYSRDSEQLLKAKALCMMWVYVIKSWAFAAGASQTIDELYNKVNSIAVDELNRVKKRVAAKVDIDDKFIIVKHGPMFYYIPGILSNYDIKEIQNSTYDIHTLMAHGYEINLTLLAKPDGYNKVIQQFKGESSNPEANDDLFARSNPFFKPLTN